MSAEPFRDTKLPKVTAYLIHSINMMMTTKCPEMLGTGDIGIQFSILVLSGFTL